MKGLRIVLCTGIDKASKLNAISAARTAAPSYMEGIALHAYDFWETLKEVAQDKGKVGKRETITQLPPGELRALRELACFRIVEKFDGEIASDRERAKHVAVVVTRTIAPSPGGFVPTLDETHELFDAEACVSVVDNIERMQSNLARDAVWAPISKSREEVLSRRQEELSRTEVWSRDKIGKDRYFLIAVNEPPDTLLGVLFPGVAGPEARKRVYLSFPMTHADEAIRRRKEEFIAQLRKRWVVFDPGSITEYEVARNQYKQARTKEERAAAKGWLERVGPVTVDNDYQLITQSDGIVVYYPSMRARVQNSQGEWVDAEQKVLSAGVIAEMIHAKNEQRTVQAIWLSEELPSPFFTRYSDPPIFKTDQEFFESLP